MWGTHGGSHISKVGALSFLNSTASKWRLRQHISSWVIPLQRHARTYVPILFRSIGTFDNKAKKNNQTTKKPPWANRCCAGAAQSLLVRCPEQQPTPENQLRWYCWGTDRWSYFFSMTWAAPQILFSARIRPHNPSGKSGMQSKYFLSYSNARSYTVLCLWSEGDEQTPNCSNNIGESRFQLEGIHVRPIKQYVNSL